MTEAALKLTPKPSEDSVSLGIGRENRSEIAEGLSEILSDTYRLLIKTHIYHWNVVGPLFHSLHEMLEEQYNDIFAATDVIAERIRALGFLAPMDMAAPNKGFANNEAKASDAKAMVEDLIADHEALVRKMREVAEGAADKDDGVSEDMLVGRMTFHEKTLWMLRATIAE
ncbi:Dps family protein [Pseudahrensia aquimaris]|uniref:Dps family protein n=1 Tax=Pseudahrensia aquimaris TaxID=744461 RepID=A0ABW3FJZ4_9HYPH